MQRLGHQTRSRSRNYRLLPPPPSAGLGSRQWLPHACASRSHTTKQRTRPGGTEPAPSQTQTQRGHRARQARAGGGSAPGVGSGRVTSGRGLAAGKGPVSPRAARAGGTSGAARRRQVCARVSRMSGEHRRGQKTLSEERWLRLLRHQTTAPGSSGGTKQNRRRKEHTAHVSFKRSALSDDGEILGEAKGERRFACRGIGVGMCPASRKPCRWEGDAEA